MVEMLERKSESTSDLPEGFKMTELGLLPEEWEVVRLGDVARVKYGAAKPKNKGTIPVVGSGGIYAYTATPLVEQPTIVIGRKGTAGRAWLLEQPCWPSDTTFYLERMSDSVDFRFVYSVFLSRPLSGDHAKTTLPSLQRPDLENYLLPLPPLLEQRAIAYVLRAVQQAKEAAESVIQATWELKKSLMRHLFTYGPVSVEEAERVPLKETEIGLVPEHWELRNIGEIADVKGGKRLPKGHNFSDRPTPYPYIRVADFKNGTVDKTNLKFLTPQDYEAIKRYTISSQDVYISIAGTIGLVGIIPPDLDGANLTENAAKIVFKNQNQIDQRFVVYFLASDSGQKQISLRITKTSQPKLALARIKQIPIPLPPLSEQREIARILDKVNKKLQAEEARKQALDTLFKTLLHNLMTGKIRVKDIALPETEEVI